MTSGLVLRISIVTLQRPRPVTVGTIYRFRKLLFSHHSQLHYHYSIMADPQKQTQAKSYHKKATGEAHETVKKRSQECDLKLFGSCFW